MEENSDKLVSIIIVTIGAKDYLWRSLESIKAQTYSNLEIIVIDNSCKPDLAAKIKKYFPSLKLYTSSKNLYYSVSLNIGLGLSNGEFILCLNDDVFLDRKFVEEALKGFMVKERIGMVSAKILRTDGITLDSTGLFLSIWRTAKERGYGSLDKGKFEKSDFVFGVSGCAAFYRKKMLDDIKEQGNYFDPVFGMFYEDLDISWRAHKRRWLAYYVPLAKALHVRGGSFRPDSGLGKCAGRRYLNDQLHAELIKNRYLTIKKNETALGLCVHLVPIILYDFIVWIFVLLFRPKVIRIFLSNLRVFFKG